jgi:Cu-Zn family superoxide dismutase
MTATTVGLAAVALASPAATAHDRARHVEIESEGPLVDLLPTAAQPTDGAEAEVEARVRHGFTVVRLSVEDLDRAAAGTHLGAHVHVGPCEAGNGVAAGPHYNVTGDPPAAINDQTEVWLDFEIGRRGKGRAEAVVPFVIPPGGAMSVVIHAQHTNPDTGAAGPRWACLPVPF